jgi:hypothetical protein
VLPFGRGVLAAVGYWLFFTYQGTARSTSNLAGPRVYWVGTNSTYRMGRDKLLARAMIWSHPNQGLFLCPQAARRIDWQVSAAAVALLKTPNLNRERWNASRVHPSFLHANWISCLGCCQICLRLHSALGIRSPLLINLLSTVQGSLRGRLLLSSTYLNSLAFYGMCSTSYNRLNNTSLLLVPSKCIALLEASSYLYIIKFLTRAPTSRIRPMMMLDPRRRNVRGW